MSAPPREPIASGSSIEEAIDRVVGPVADAVGSVVFARIPGTPLPFVVAWLVAAAVIITCYLGFIQVRGLKVSFDVARGRYSRPDDPGEVTHFQALATALSGTVGLGNIAGVAIAVSLGGPGATFWMVLAGLLGMATKFAECTIGHKYREVHDDGTVSGGAFTYLPVAFARFGKPVATALTGIFAVAILLFGAAGGNMFQANQTIAQLRVVTGGTDGLLGSADAAFVAGIVLALGVAVVIIGGMRSIGRVTAKLVPAMAIVYVTACLVVILGNLGHVPAALASILTGAFSPQAGLGGLVGVLVVGFQRAAFSNEAGLGSAPIAHSTVKTRRPVSEGFVAALEPFADTVVICTMTALTIVIADTPMYRAAVAKGGEGMEGVALTSDAFASEVSWFPYVLAVAVALFAFSTLLTWSYYGQKAWEHLVGRGRVTGIVYKLVFCGFTVLGAVLTLDKVVELVDSFLFICAFINILAIYLLLPEVRREMKDYLADRRSGLLDAQARGEAPVADAGTVGGMSAPR